MRKILCFLGFHNYQNEYTGYRDDAIEYLLCEYCGRKLTLDN